MPDIAMCRGNGCPLKCRCWRFLAKPDHSYQYYFVTSPVKDGKCEYYWHSMASMHEVETEVVSETKF